MFSRSVLFHFTFNILFASLFLRWNAVTFVLVCTQIVGLIYYYSDTVELIVYYVWGCVVLVECLEVCHGGYEGEYEHVYVFMGGSTSITKGMHIHILGVRCDYENVLLCISYFFTYVQILISLMFAISTHFLVDTEFPIFMSVCYIHVMYAYVCDPYDTCNYNSATFLQLYWSQFWYRTMETYFERIISETIIVWKGKIKSIRYHYIPGLQTLSLHDMFYITIAK